jgi:hypothetical protein
MVDGLAGFRLPLMHHLVEHRMSHLRPVVPGDVPPADPDLER